MRVVVLIALLCLAPVFSAVSATLPEIPEVPQWVLHGILGVETSSFYAPTGEIVYINRKRGRAGERGPFQMTPAVFRETMGVGDVDDLAVDTEFAQSVFIRRMQDLYARLGSWDASVRAYNVGVRGALLGRGNDYLDDVKTWAQRIHPAPREGVVARAKRQPRGP
jgi:hypothetical protein